MGTLILTRKEHQAVIIDDTVRIEIREIRGDQIRIAITAPDAMQIWREEIWFAIKEEREAKADNAEDRKTVPQPGPATKRPTGTG